MARKASSTSAASDFDLARDGQDLVPGNARAIAAATDGVSSGRGALSDVAAGLARTATTLTWVWSGPAATAFAEHRQAVIATTDRWEGALSTVRAALDAQEAAVSASQDMAGDALASWQRARQLAAQEPRLLGPGSELAANAEATRAQLHATIAAARQRAETLLSQARGNLADASQGASQVVREAIQVLRDNPLPAVHEAVSSATAATAPSTEQAGRSGLAIRLPGWSGATVTVMRPTNGVHDTLWRIAGRELGDPRRWPEIYRLNVGQPVGAHAVLTDPNVLQPDWTLRLPPATPLHPVVVGGVPVLHGTPAPHPVVAGGHALAPSGPGWGTQPAPGPFPTSPPATTAPAPDPVGTVVPPSSGAIPPPSPLVTTPAPGLNQPPPSSAPTTPGALSVTPSAGHGDSGVDLGDGLVVAGGVAAALAGIVVATGFQRRYAARRTAHATEQPEPVVRRLTADLTAVQAPSPAPAQVDKGTRPGPAVVVPVEVGQRPGISIPLGQRDGRAVLADIAATMGLGLTGPGAFNAARGMLISTLTMQRRATVVMSAYDLRGLSGIDPASLDHARTAQNGSPGDHVTAWDRVTVAANLHAVLDRLEAEILTRTRLLEDTAGRVSAPPLMVFTSVPSDTRRLQAVADLGAGLGIAIVVLGRWRAGVTCVVDVDGRVIQTHGEYVTQWNLAGMRLFTAGLGDTASLLVHLATRPAPPSAPTVATPLPPRTHTVGTRVDSTAARTAAAPQEGLITRRLAPDHLPDSPAPGEIAQRLGGPITESGTPVTTLPDGLDNDLDPERSGVRVAAGTAESKRRFPHPNTTTAPGSAAETPATHDASVAGPVDTVRVPLILRALGPVRLSFRPAEDGAAQDITGDVGPRLRELLVFIALQPDGVRRDEVVQALWPDTNPRRHTHALNAALARLRRSLTHGTQTTLTDLIVHTDQRLRLDPAVATVDLWQFQDAWNAARNATEPHSRAIAYRRMISLYNGPFADDVDTDWITAPRQSLHRAATDAVSSLARLLVDTDPQQTLDLLDSARTWDPYNEHIYRDIMRLQAKLGQPGAITRTVELLTIRLAEISATPSRETSSLADALLQRASADA